MKNSMTHLVFVLMALVLCNGIVLACFMAGSNAAYSLVAAVLTAVALAALFRFGTKLGANNA